MAQIKISIINASTVVSDQEIIPVVAALGTQVSRDFAPVWGVDADLDFVKRGQEPPAGHWQLGVFDNSDQAGALGYHDVTLEGLPLGKIFAGTDIQFGTQWSVTASHELLEMLGDPAINLTALVMTPFEIDKNLVGRLYAYEVCDACEADEDGYMIDGVLLSDFVYPAWFEPFRTTGSTQFDQRLRITDPFQLLPGGYASVYDMTSGSGWQQISRPMPRARVQSQNSRAPVGSRRERRRTPHNQWLKSAPGTGKKALPK